jgi:hypothetical protein
VQYRAPRKKPACCDVFDTAALAVILAGTKELMYVSAMSTDVRPAELENPVLPQPLVMYKRNPFENDFGEWHQVWCTPNPNGEFALCATHGWWDEAQKTRRCDGPVLDALYHSVESVIAAFYKRIDSLEKDGFTYKLQNVFDPATGVYAPRIVP